MNPLQKILIVVGLALAIGLVLAQRNQQRGPPHIDPTTQTNPTPRPRLVDLGAGKCVPCKAMAPILEELRHTHAEQFEVVFIDVWENPEAAKPYDINLIPTQIFFDADGKERWRHEGFLAKEDILAKWKELGVEKIGGLE